jgi:RNA polymerase sigma factor (sigma-70 family)
VNSQTDQELLREYAMSRSDAAFAELVCRHVDLVYSAALRMVRDSHLAQDVAQSVFVALSQNASALTDRTLLAGWLHRTTQNLASNIVRADVRRRAREQEAFVMNELLSGTSDPTWDQIAPHVDEALSKLNDADRDVVLSRYFQRKSARELAEDLGVTEEAAQKRVNRAVGRLRKLLNQSGVAVGAGTLGILISANAMQAAPVALGGTIITATHLTSGSIASAAHTLLMTTTQKVIYATLLTALIGAGVYEGRRAFLAEARVLDLERRQSPLSEQLSQLGRERDDVMNQLAGSKRELELLRRQLGDLPKLRGEVTRLQRDADENKVQSEGANADATEAAMKSWLKKVRRLKQRFEQTPEARIPEFQFLTEQDWLNAANGDLNDEKDYRGAMSSLRGAAETKFVFQLQPALRKYMKEHNKSFPADISELQAYFETPVDAAILGRYEILLATDFPGVSLGGKWIITQKSAVDDEYDHRLGIGPNGYGNSGTTGWNKDTELASAGKVLAPIEKQYKAAHNGAEPTNPADVLPYLTTPEQHAAYETLLKAHKEQEADDAK